MPPIISVVGYSNSGKTFLLEHLIPILKSKGYTIGVIKHTRHDFPLDKPGKDTYKFKQAGAEGVILVGSGQIGYLSSLEEEDSMKLDRLVEKFFMDLDLVITEGFKKSEKPKIAVLTKGQEEQLHKEIGGPILATVGEKPWRSEIPHFNAGDYGGLALMIEERFIKDQTKPSIRVLLDGKSIPINHFDQESARKGIMGLLSPLKGFKHSQVIEIKIHSPKKR